MKGKQFPVCARCTGAFAGYLTGILSYSFINVPIWLSLLFCLIMFVDWLIQRLCILESDNIRRLITGMLCGFGLMRIYIEALTACTNVIL